MTDVLVVGAGPVGLTLAAELARHGVPCRLIDRLPAPLPYCRAIGVTPRTLEVWDDMGLVREAIDAGLWFEGLRLRIADAPVRDVAEAIPGLPYGTLSLPQPMTEAMLAQQFVRLGGKIERGVALEALRQDQDAVTATLMAAGGSHETATFRYVVGCDGAHSAVRRLLGIPFEGEALPTGFMLGDVRIAWPAGQALPRGMALRVLRPKLDAAPDMLIAVPLPERDRYRISMLAPPELAGDGEGHGIQSERPVPEVGQLQAVVDALLPDPPRLEDLRWASVFKISMRLAAAYRRGRAFIAGDAAHIHPPTGGQGMNTGIQDAYNLAWKLALVVAGAAPAALLDSYEAERRPVGEEVIARTLAASINLGREKTKPDPMVDTQLLVGYRGGDWVQDDGGDGPLRAGDRAPDVLGLTRRHVVAPFRLHDVLRGPEHVLLLPGDTDGARLEAWVDALPAAARGRLRLVALNAGELPSGVAQIDDPADAFAAAYGRAVHLIRPDKHVGWRGPCLDDPGLARYLGRLFAGT